MLGHTNVGKTTYMASMYGTLQTPIHGFSLRAKNDGHHQELQAMHQNIRWGRYPLPSQQRQQYDFSLLYAGRAVFPFEWVDYRGGALLEQSTSAQTSQLVSDLREADSMVLFCDSDPKERRNVLRQVNRMMQFVGQALQNREKPATVAIVFTKVDLVDGPYEEVYKPTVNLMQTIATSKTVIGTLIPVACGRAPVNTELPVLFVLYFGIVLQANFLAQQIEYFKKIEEESRREGNTWGGIFRDFGRAFTNKPTTSQIASAAHSLAVARRNEIEKLIEPSKQLGEYLKELRVF